MSAELIFASFLSIRRMQLFFPLSCWLQITKIEKCLFLASRRIKKRIHSKQRTSIAGARGESTGEVPQRNVSAEGRFDDSQTSCRHKVTGGIK